MGSLLFQRLGLQKEQVQYKKDYWAIEGWNRTLIGLSKEYNPDIIFFGNSITYYGKWENYLSNIDKRKILVMGYPGDDIKGMMLRIQPLHNLKPKKIFLMAGINGLNNMSLQDFGKQYESLVSEIIKTTPRTTLLLESILPIDATQLKNPNDYPDNKKISEANKIIKSIASSYGLTYINVYGLFSRKGKVIGSKLRDGVHPTAEAYKPWYKLLYQYIED